jgi:hypothetical protein
MRTIVTTGRFAREALLVLRLSLLGSVSAGCGVQLGAGTTPGSIPPKRSVYTTTSVQTANLRTSGATVGMRLGWLPDGEGLHLRNALLSFGYDEHFGASSPFGVEGLLDIGAGGSAFSRFDGVGMYGGLALSPRFRLLGHADQEPGFNILLYYVDLVATGRGGIWAPPEDPDSHHSYWEWAVEGGLRITFASDIVNAPARSETSDPPFEGAK